MGRHRKQNLYMRYAARTVPVVALSSLLLIPHSHAHMTADALRQTPDPVRTTAPMRLELTPHPRLKPPEEVTRHVEHVATLSFNEEVVKAAKTQIGVPYVWGGEMPGVAFDCSGLTEWAYKHAGKYIPRVADDQFRFFREIPKSQARPGDLVFFHDSSGYVFHVGIYDGGTTMIAAPHSGADVGIEDFSWGAGSATYGTLDIH